MSIKDAEQNPEKYSFFSRIWSKKEPEVKKTSTITTQPTKVTDKEDIAIKEWVNNKYSGYNDAYKSAMYKDAYNAVLQRKGEVEKAQLKERERKEKAELASYQGNDKVKTEQAKLAKAQNAITDAAELIRSGQELNGARVDKSLTDKETVDKFLLANNGKPYAEYVMKFIQSQMGGGDVSNKWLADKLGINGEDAKKSADRMDKFDAGVKGVGQGLVDLTQNTIGAGANYISSNLLAGLGELGYGAANALGADTSEGTIWDKMKKAKGYSRSEARDEANSHLEKGVLSEDQRAFDIGEGIGQNLAATALTAPAEAAIGSAIFASKLPGMGKFTGTVLNGLGGGLGFQAVEDLSKGELSSLGDYAKSGLIGAGSAGVGNVLAKGYKVVKPGAKNLGRAILGPSEKVENALLKKTPKEYNLIDSINKAYTKNPNVGVSPYTKMADVGSKAKKTIYNNRITAGQDLQDIRQNLKYIEGSEYTRENVKEDLNKALRNLADEKKYGQATKELDQIPQFEIKDGKLVLSDKSMEELNAFNGINSKGKEVNLGDEIINLYNRVYGMGGKDNAANTHYFIQELKSLYNKGWSGGNPNILKETINSLDQIDNKFYKSLYASDRDALKKATKVADKAINLDESWDKLIGAMRGNDIEKVKEAVKAYKGGPSIEQLYRDVWKATNGKVDMNNEILAWAYNLSLHDLTKAKDLLNTFYPSKAGLIETVLQGIAKPLRSKVANEIVESGVKSKDLYSNALTDTSKLDTAFAKIAESIYQDYKD